MGNAATKGAAAAQLSTKESPVYLYLEEELQQKKEEHGWHHAEVADVCHRQGELLDAKGDYRDAMDKFLEALDIRKQVFGDKDEIVAETFFCIACALEHQGSHAQAVDFFQEAIAIQKEKCGPESKQVGNSLDRMACSQGQLENKYEDALESLWEAHRIRELLKDEMGISETLFHVGQVHQKKGDTKEALSYYEKGLEIALRKEEPRRALEIMEEALPLMILVNGRSDETVATLLLQQGVLLDEVGKYKEAMDNFSAALDIRQSKFGKKHPSVAETWYIMGCSHVQQDSYEQAIMFFEEAIMVQKERCGLTSKECGDSKNMLGYAQYKLGELDAAMYSLSDALGIRKLRGDKEDIAKTFNTIKAVQRAKREELALAKKEERIRATETQVNIVAC